MRRLTSIVAVNAQGVIGLGNSLPWRVRSDLRFFKEQTLGNAIIMGRKTHDSLGRCLPDRFNVVVSHQFSLFENSNECVLEFGIGEALVAAENSSARFKEIFVIGGASMYEQYASLVDRYLITIVDKLVPDGDAFFDPRIVDENGEWETKRISSGLANDAGDEVGFQIFELIARDQTDRQEKRRQAIAEIKSRGRPNARRAPPQRTGDISKLQSFAF